MSLRVDLVRTERRRKGQSISSISPGNGSVINDVIQIWAFSTPPPHPCSPYVPVSQNYKPPSASPYLHDINYECTLTIIQWLLWLIKFQTSLVFISWPSVCNSRYASHGIVNKPSEYRTQESDVQRVPRNSGVHYTNGHCSGWIWKMNLKKIDEIRQSLLREKTVLREKTEIRELGKSQHRHLGILM